MDSYFIAAYLCFVPTALWIILRLARRQVEPPRLPPVRRRRIRTVEVPDNVKEWMGGRN